MNCRHHPACPGCPLLNNPYAEQLQRKQRRIADAFALFPHLIRGHTLSDVVAVLGSLNIIAAELDR